MKKSRKQRKLEKAKQLQREQQQAKQERKERVAEKTSDGKKTDSEKEKTSTKKPDGKTIEVEDSKKQMMDGESTTTDRPQVKEQKQREAKNKEAKEHSKVPVWKSMLCSLETYFILLFVIFEVLFHFVKFGTEGENLHYKILFAIFYGGCTGLVVSAISKLGAKILTPVITGIVTIYYIAQIIYSGVFHTYLSLIGTIGVAGQALDFIDIIWDEIQTNWWVLLLMLLPFVLYLSIIRKKLSYKRQFLSVYLLGIVVMAALYGGTYYAMTQEERTDYCAYEVYTNYDSVDMAVVKLGITKAFWLDTVHGIKERMGMGEEETDFVVEELEEVTEEATTEMMADSTEEGTTEEVIDKSPNALDIDFEKLIAEETDENIKALHEYIQTVTPTNKNEYTGMFEGYNLIFVTAEAFSGYVLDPKLTPTLYKMSREGFHFTNYYTPLWYGSTSGGEYANLTGMMPKSGGYLSMQKAGKNGNDMMFTLSKQLLKKDYRVLGYHNNDYTYYDRDITHPNLGYEWIGVGNGYEPELNEGGSSMWPQSDLRMIQNTFDDYKGEEPFHVYYMSVSGHCVYSNGGNAMSARHKDYVADLDYSDTTKAYIAAQYELELAMKELVAKLETAGLAEKTLIVIAADHVPYNDMQVLDELAGRDLEDTFEAYKNSLIIWSASMEEPIVVDKVCSSLDVLPTVSNLMGLPYDSRMMVGQDILSTTAGMVYFNDRSFLTDKCSYNASTGKVISFGNEVTDNYVEARKAMVKNKFSMAESICNYDYYRYIREAVYGTD